MKTGRAYSSGIEGVPLMPAATGPQIVFARGPPTKGASNSRPAWLLALLLLKLTIQNGGIGGLI